jgi:hypothetical protein
MTIPPPPRARFGEEFVAEWRRRWIDRPAHERPLTYDIAADDEFAERRRWYGEQIDLLPEPAATEITEKLWRDRHIWPCTLELATGAWLRAAGFAVGYEREWDNLTPDWTAFHSGGRPAAFVEVHTDEPRQGVYGRIRAWHSLKQRIATIPAPYVLTLAAPRRNATPPDPKTAKKITADLRAGLLRVQPLTRVRSHGYTFIVIADRRTGGPMASPYGIRACFQPPSEIAGEVSARRIAQGAARKVARYTGLADMHGVPLIVATGAHPFTGVDLSNLDDLLTGNPTITFQFNHGDTFVGDRTVTLDRPETWAMPPELSAIVWIDNRFPFRASVRANPGTVRPLPEHLRAGH